MTSLGAHPASDSLYTHASLFQWYGDCNGDRYTDFTDFSDFFLPAFGTEKGVDAEYVEELDGQPDNFVDFTDFTDFFLPKFGTSPDDPSAEPEEFPQ